MQTEFSTVEQSASASTPAAEGQPRIYLELKGGAVRWLAVDSQSANSDERSLVMRIWQATRGGRVGIVVEMPDEFDRLVSTGVAPTSGNSHDPRPVRYIVYQRIDESGEILLRLRYFALAKFHYAQIPGADRSASLRQSAQPSG